ncbi:MAG: LuxR family transcriptional regulator, partial [Chloroflexi bacterium]|nr:LuxR family transcriptional regulator [Chloroflexota bacterium]
GLGVLLSSEGDAIRARSLLEQALELFRAHGDVGGIGASLLGLGDLALRAGDRAHGRAYLEGAVAQLSDAGQLAWHAVALLRFERAVPAHLIENSGPAVIAVYWRGALGREMPPSVILGPTNATRNSSSVAGNPLTPREREVLALVARHYSNREVADELVLSVRTVERHIANIYTKLGVSSRRLATVYARQQGVLVVE